MSDDRPPWPWGRRVFYAALLVALFYAGAAGAAWRRAARTAALLDVTWHTTGGRADVTDSWLGEPAPAVRWYAAVRAALPDDLEPPRPPAGLREAVGDIDVRNPLPSEARRVAALWHGSPRLTDLAVRGRRVPRDVLAALPTDPGPHRLALGDVPHRSVALEAAGRMPRLRVLVLDGGTLTAADAAALAASRSLRIVVLRDVRLVRLAPADLRAALPGVLVVPAAPPALGGDPLAPPRAPAWFPPATAPAAADWPRVTAWPAP